MLEHSIAETVAGLEREDRQSYRELMEPLAEGFEAMMDDVLGPMLHVPRHPLLMARFGFSAVQPAATLARRFGGVRARGLFAGMAAHSVQALESPMSAAVALLLMAAGHASGWPIARGGAQTITDELVRYLVELGGRVEPGREADDLSRPEYAVTLADVTPRQLLAMRGGVLPEGDRRRLEKFAYGAGVFKVDYALREPIPWRAKECLRAGTVHVGGTLEEIAESERTFRTERPFVLVVQPSLFDGTRAPEGRHTAWAYCHVPNGSERDWLGVLEAQMGPVCTRVRGVRAGALGDGSGGVGALECEPGRRGYFRWRDESGADGVPAHAVAVSNKCQGGLSLRGVHAAWRWGAWDGGVPCGDRGVARFGVAELAPAAWKLLPQRETWRKVDVLDERSLMALAADSVPRHASDCSIF